MRVYIYIHIMYTHIPYILYREYNDVCGRSLSRKDVGGSPQCLDRVRAAFTEMGEMLLQKGYALPNFVCMMRMYFICKCAACTCKRMCMYV